jgi:hypothetical protein
MQRLPVLKRSRQTQNPKFRARIARRLHGMQEVGGSIPPGSTSGNFEFGKSAFETSKRSAPASEIRGTYRHAAAPGQRVRTKSRQDLRRTPECQT